MNLNLGKPILFATCEYEYLKAQMLASRRFVNGQVARSVAKDGSPSFDDVAFPDGERYHRLITNVVDREVVLLGGTENDRSTMELLDLGMGLAMEGAARIKLVVPYFAYSTMERAIHKGELVKAKTRAMLISSIPRGAMANWVYLMDLHSEGIPHYFENGVITRHVYAKSLIIQAIQDAARQWQHSNSLTLSGSTGGGETGTRLRIRTLTCRAPDAEAVFEDSGQNLKLADFTVASTDAGRAKWVESLCRDMVKLGLPVHPAFIIKRRISGDQTVVADISADVKGKLVIIYDDMIRTGGSAIAAARAYLSRGAKAVILVSTHGVLPGESKKKLFDSDCFWRVIVTDTHPRALQLQDDFLRVIPTGSLLVDAVLGPKGKKAE